MSYERIVMWIMVLIVLSFTVSQPRAESSWADLTDEQLRLLDPNYCGKPERDSRGQIVRSKAVLEQFERLFPLPAHLKREDFEINHGRPRVCGGCDTIGNLIWMSKQSKRGKGGWQQDSHEQLTMCLRSFHK